MRQKKLSVNSSVEVTSLDPGFLGAWYEATILSRSSKTYKIRYKNLIEEDKKTPCVEDVAISFVRPMPPKIIDSPDIWLPGHAVEAYWNDGWWQGTIDTRVSKDIFRVYFQYSAERLDIPLKDLRTGQVWNGGKWTIVTELSSPAAKTNKVATTACLTPNVVWTVNKLESNPPISPPSYTFERKRSRSVASLVEPQICSDNQEKTIPLSIDLDSLPGKSKVMRTEGNDVKVQWKKDCENHQQPVGFFSEVQQPRTPSECGELPANQYRQRWYSHSGSMWTSPVQRRQWAIKECSGPVKTNNVARPAAIHAYRAVLRAFYQEGSALDLGKLKVMADLRIAFNIPNSCHVELLQLLRDPAVGCFDDVASSHLLHDH